MASGIRELRRRARTVTSIRKTTRAFEMIATARIAKAQQRVAAAKPYSDEITRALSALAGSSTLDHPLLTERKNPKRVAVVVVTADRGLCGAYNSAVIRAAEELQSLLRSEGKQPVLYVLGRRGVGYYKFRQREIADAWTGFSDQPTYLDAREAARTLIRAFVAGADDDEEGAGDDGVLGVDEIHVVHTQFKSMLSQQPVANRVVPLVVEEVEYESEAGKAPLLPAYEFEPDAEALLDALLPKYVTTRIYAALLEASASENAARRRAMKAATDNANDLIKEISRDVNQLRQGQITQEISEIVGGADALAAAAGSDD